MLLFSNMLPSAVMTYVFPAESVNGPDPGLIVWAVGAALVAA
jgi:hypothetical protein